MEIGLYTLSELVTDPNTGHRIGAPRRIEETVAAARLADEVGLDVFAIGEHHRPDYAVSSPVVVLGAIAAVTRKIRLSTAVTVLGAADPVRVFEDFATLDLLSDGRAEMMLGRGAFGEPFELAGVSGDRYDAAFVENFELLRLLGRQERVTWSGSTRPTLRGAAIAPRPVQAEVPAWIAVGGSAASAERAGRLGAPLALAALGGPVHNLVPTVNSYRAAGLRARHAPSRLKIAVAAHAYVGASSQTARDDFFPYYTRYWAEALGTPHPLSRLARADFDRMTAPEMMLMVGSPQEIAEKILMQHELLGHDRFLAQLDIGGQPLAQVLKSIERLAGEVAPLVRQATRARSASKPMSDPAGGEARPEPKAGSATPAVP